MLHSLLSLGVLLQAAAPAAGEKPSALPTIIMFAAIFLVMWLFMIRPQRKQQKEQEKFRAGLQKGDKVVTAGGIHGTIAEVQSSTVLLKVDGDVKLKVEKASLQKDFSEADAPSTQK